MAEGDLGALKRRLEKLEKTLRELAESAESELAIARELQKLLNKNRLPEIAGLSCYTRYHSAGDLCGEAFDILQSQDKRSLWIVCSWTQNFGLSAVLLQALVHLQSQAAMERSPSVDTAQLFNDIATSLAQARKAGAYRLLVAQLHLPTLKMEGYAVGMPPWLRRQPPTAGGARAWDFVQPEMLRQRPELLQAADSRAPTLAADAYAFSFNFVPGSRLLLLTPSWNAEALAESQNPLEAFARPLQLLPDSGQDAGGDLLADLNHLMLRAREHMKRVQQQADLTCLAFEVDAKRLHLA